MFLVDASKEMFVKGEDDQPSNFDLTMQVRPSLTIAACQSCLCQPSSYRMKWKIDYSDSDFKPCLVFVIRVLLLAEIA